MNLYEKIGEEKIDELVIHMYDDIIPNDDRINLLFNEGLDIDTAIKKFVSQKINSLTMQMINTI